MKADILILGGGAIGANVAFELSKNGYKVILLEKNVVASGSSGASAAMLEAQLEAHRGEPFFDLATKSQNLFPSLYEEIKDKTKIDFEYERCGILQVALTESDVTQLQSEVTRQSHAGLKAKWLTQKDLRSHWPQINPAHLGGAFYGEDGQINGRIFTEALIKAAQLHGAIIKEKVGDLILKKANQDTIEIESASEMFLGSKVVVAAGAWSAELLESFNLVLESHPIRGELVVFSTPTRPVPCPIYTTQMGYVTPKRGITFVGSTMEDVGFQEEVSDKTIQQLTQQGIFLVPSLAKSPVLTVTSAFRPGSVDGLPYIGHLPEAPNVIVATGHLRNGIMLAPITAKIVTALVSEEKWPTSLLPFSPTRALRYSLS